MQKTGKKQFLNMFIKSAVVTLVAISLILTGYFTAGYLSGGL